MAFRPCRDLSTVVLGQVTAKAPERWSVALTDPELGADVALVLAARAGRVVVYSVGVSPVMDGTHITGTLLRRLPLDGYVRLVLERSDLLREQGNGTSKPLSRPARDRALRPNARRRDAHGVLQDVAVAYRTALASPATRDRPTEAAAEALGYSRGHVSRLVTRARQAGLLGAAHQGRGGES